MTLDLITGLVNRDKKLPGTNPDQYDLREQPFGDLSLGALSVSFGVEHASIASNRSFKSIGAQVSVGLDTERIRDVFQNLFIHNLMDLPHVPKQNRALQDFPE